MAERRVCIYSLNIDRVYIYIVCIYNSSTERRFSTVDLGTVLRSRHDEDAFRARRRRGRL